MEKCVPDSSGRCQNSFFWLQFPNKTWPICSEDSHTYTLDWLSWWASRGGEGVAQIPVGKLERARGARVRHASSRLNWVRRRDLEEGGVQGCGAGEWSSREAGGTQRALTPSAAVAEAVTAATAVAAQNVVATLARVPAQACRCAGGSPGVWLFIAKYEPPQNVVA